jgi:hypothetical protein
MSQQLSAPVPATHIVTVDADDDDATAAAKLRAAVSVASAPMTTTAPIDVTGDETGVYVLKLLSFCHTIRPRTSCALPVRAC